MANEAGVSRIRMEGARSSFPAIAEKVEGLTVNIHHAHALSYLLSTRIEMNHRTCGVEYGRGRGGNGRIELGSMGIELEREEGAIFRLITN